MPELLLDLTVRGTPGPQGSKTPTGRYRRTKAGGLAPILRESSRKVEPWRNAVHNAAQTWTLQHRPFELLTGPLAAEMYFTLERGKTVKRPWPTVYPDISKLCRSTEDALTGLIWGDDAQIVHYHALNKSYPGGHPLAPTQPGVRIRLWSYPE